MKRLKENIIMLVRTEETIVGNFINNIIQTFPILVAFDLCYVVDVEGPTASDLYY